MSLRSFKVLLQGMSDKGVIAGHSLYYYYKIAEWPLFLVLIIELLWRILGGHVIFGWFGGSHYLSLPWVLRISLFIYLGWFVVFRQRRGWREAVFVGSIAGIIIGFVIGIFSLIWYHDVKSFLDFIALPWQTFILGALVTSITAAFLKNWKMERDSLQERPKPKS